eukprot:5681920-Pleurochrysis_carterae.AAC.2
MSRYPLDLKEGEHSVASIPDDLFDVLASVEVNGKPAVYLCEPRNQKDIETIWEAEVACCEIADEDKLTAIRADERLPTRVRRLPRDLIGHLTTLDVAPEFEGGSDVHCNALLGASQEDRAALELQR